MVLEVVREDAELLVARLEIDRIVTTEAVAALARDCERILARQTLPPKLLIDWHRVAFSISNGLGVLIGFDKRLKAGRWDGHSVQLHFCGLRADLEAVLCHTRIDRAIPCTAAPVEACPDVFGWSDATAPDH